MKYFQSHFSHFKLSISHSDLLSLLLSSSGGGMKTQTMSLGFQCSNCPFKSSSKKGIKVGKKLFWESVIILFSKGAREPNPREGQASVWNGIIFSRHLFISSKSDKVVKSNLKVDQSRSALQSVRLLPWESLEIKIYIRNNSALFVTDLMKVSSHCLLHS